MSDVFVRERAPSVGGAPARGESPSTTFAAPAWLPKYVPELDGLRGIAVAAVVLYHSHAKLEATPFGRFVEFGWAGVNLFFVLSGFLITGIILDSRADGPNFDPRFFRNFYARRALRIWPVYLLLLALYYFFVPLLFVGTAAARTAVSSAPWLYYALFVQNLFALGMPGPITPTWSLAIEEQYYLAWAPLARRLKMPVLAGLLVAMIVASPLIRHFNPGTLVATNTLIHLDGIAFGSLIALLLRVIKPKDDDINQHERAWRNIGFAAAALGLVTSAFFLYRGSAITDSALALLFSGLLLLALTTTGKRSIYAAALRSTPLRFIGRISYGLYMIHVLVFVLIGRLDELMLPHGNLGAYVVVATRIALSVTAAAIMWYGFERPILRLKQRFQ